jgi:thiamine kinase-like enzyme
MTSGQSPSTPPAHRSAPDEERAVIALRRLLGDAVGQESDLGCSRLGGGLGARSYLVTSPHGEWVVRLPHRGGAGEVTEAAGEVTAGEVAADDVPASDVSVVDVSADGMSAADVSATEVSARDVLVGEVLDMAAEHALTACAAAAGLAPSIAASDTASGVLITEYLRSARAWSATDARRPENIRRLAALLRRLHALPVQLPAFRPLRSAARYVADSEPADADSLVWAEELRRAAHVFEARHAASVPCHNDLAAANVLDDGRLWLVDFEYAAQSSPLLDLANVSAMNDFDADCRRMLLEAYFEGTPAPFAGDDLDEALRMLRLLWHFWARALARRAADPLPYARFAERMASALREAS